MSPPKARAVAVLVVVVPIAVALYVRLGRGTPSPKATLPEGARPATAGLATTVQSAPGHADPMPSQLRPAGAQPPSTPSENELMGRLRDLEDVDAAAALALARDGDLRFPNGIGAAERAYVEIKSLARQGHLSEARGAAERMVNEYRGTPWALEVERHTGAHPRANQQAQSGK